MSKTEPGHYTQREQDRRRLQDLIDDADHGREVYMCSLGVAALRRLL